MNSHASLFRPGLLAGLMATALLTGCQSYKLHRNPPSTLMPVPATFLPNTVEEVSSLDPTLLHRPEIAYRLGPGDVLDIEVVGDMSSRTRTVVGPDGRIYFHILPGIDVWGLTIGQARASLVRGMRQYVREDPPLSLSLASAQSQKVWLLGRLNQPGLYPLTGPTTLLEAISNAGGPSPLALAGAEATGLGAFGGHEDAADLRRAFVIRDGRMLPVNFERLLRQGDLSHNIYLQPDDFVYLPSTTTGRVHVLGAVNGPRAIEFNRRMTLAQAVAEAGGLHIREAYPKQVAIVRGSLSDPRVATVDLTEIMRGAANDILLEPEDIVYVPHSPYRVVTRLVDTILNTFVRVVGVNEGARAVSDRATATGVTVPLGPL
jgi:polysaccharide biosynthesis/export protein